MFVYWREISVMMGCKWVPNTLTELENFRRVRLYSSSSACIKLELIEWTQDFEAKEQNFSHWNVTFSDAMLDAILFSVPGFLKPAGRKCLIAILDEDVRRCNG